MYRLRNHGDAVCDLGQSGEKELHGDGQPQFLDHGGEHGKQHNVTAKSGQGFKTVHYAGVYDFKIHLRSGCRSFYCRRRREPAYLAQRVPPVGKRRQIEQQIACRGMGGQGELPVQDKAADKDGTDVVGDKKEDVCLLLCQLTVF